MAYQIKCDDYILFDPRDEDLIVCNPKCNLEVNTVGEASFSIFSNHPYYDQLRKMRSIFEILQDGDPIFRGRMTEDTKDFYNTKLIDLEGVLAFLNDSVIRPFVFPDDFLGNEEYTTAAKSGNVIEFFLSWVIDQHNSQVLPFQQLKLGKVTVTDPNNYLFRSSVDHLSSWEIVKTKLFDSSLGGYLCIRYEADGNYVDYLADFELTNTQGIEYGENLLDLSSNADALATYSAIIPLGKKKDESDTESVRLTIENLPDGEITDDIVKSGDTLFSKSAVAQYGWIYAPTSETTWEDVTEAANLQTKGTDFLTNTGMKLSNTITVKAVDLHYSDDEIASFRIYRYITLHSKPHNQEDLFRLTKLEIDIQNPQNTIITLGDTHLSLTDINASSKHNAEEKVEGFLVNIQTQITQEKTEILKSCEELYNTKIEQLSKSITLELSGSLGNKASIKLAIGGEEYTDEIALDKVREAFANDNTSAVISAGTVTFNSGTIVINSNNFKVSSQGVIEATSGTIGAITLCTTGIYSHNSSYSRSYAGWYRPATITTDANCFFAGASDSIGTNAKFLVTYGGALTATDATIKGEIITESSVYMAKLSGGGLELYFDGVLCGTLNTKYWSGAATEGISLRIEEGGNYIMFSHPNSDYATGFEVDYYLNYGWSSNYDEMHIFQTSARFLDDVYFAGYTRIRSLRLFGANGEYLVGISASGQLEISKL